MYATAEEIKSECQLREAFVQRRLCRPASPAELKDLTGFFHQANANLLVCGTCALLVRQELESCGAEQYSEDEYDPSVIERQLPSYVAAFRKKEITFRPLLPATANVVEVGSHYGAFLQVAQEWGWHIQGVDVGGDTSRFAQSKGFKVHRCELQQCAFPQSSFDAVFIWNCFEQIQDPAPLLAESRRILKAGGVLVLRVPNALFYTRARALRDGVGLKNIEAEFLVDALGYNNLLGFPYLYGYGPETLARVAGRHDFVESGSVNSELLTFPLPENPAWVGREERQISTGVRLLASSILESDGALIGPWIESWFVRP